MEEWVPSIAAQNYQLLNEAAKRDLSCNPENFHISHHSTFFSGGREKKEKKSKQNKK